MIQPFLTNITVTWDADGTKGDFTVPTENGNEVLTVNDYINRKRARWVLLDECYNEGVYCSACHKKVYKKCYANQKIKSKFCPNCGARMDVTR